MKQQKRQYKSQLVVIGSGLAGFAASIFAHDRGINTAQIGNTGAVAYTTGYFDLLGVDQDGVLDNPWQGLDGLRRQAPEHPLSRIGEDDVRTAFCRFTAALSEMGIGYTSPGPHNVMALLPSGVVKPTLSLPLTMQAGAEAYRTGARTLIAGFVGMQGFSAKEMVANLKPTWADLRATTLTFPDMESGAQLYPEVMARALEVPANRARLAVCIKAALGDATCVGLPAILGIHAPDFVHGEMEKLIGVPLFEIPTLPPAVPGIRLREMFEQALPAMGLTLVPQQKAKRLDFTDNGATVYLDDSFGEVVIEAEAAVLATGRFLSGGLIADHSTVRESLMDISVFQPDNREDWHRQHYFDPRGHPINRSGINVDAHNRPLAADGKPVHHRLFAAGTVLAHQDWVRQRCGAGVAITSAYQAVKAVSEIL